MPSSNTVFVPDMTDKTVIVTGANSGIGFATAKTLAARGARVVLAVRDVTKGQRAADSIQGVTEVRKIDLASLDSVRAFASAWNGPIDVLINNAGASSPTLRRTADGFELLFGTNHLGPFALTNLLLPNVVGRVVMLGSQAERMGRINFDDLNWERTPYNAFRSYANSKLANLLFTMELQRRLGAAGSGVIATVAHPGLVSTNIYAQASGLFTRLMVRLAQSPEMGALPVLYAAVGDIPGASFTGPKDFMHMRGAPELIKCSKTAQNKELASRLWTVSEELTGVKFALKADRLSDQLQIGSVRTVSARSSLPT
jgi:NAD(P)-dependent dehydrogenase (short-subunit alcohol dehydrogenase family)